MYNKDKLSKLFDKHSNALGVVFGGLLVLLVMVVSFAWEAFCYGLKVWIGLVVLYYLGWLPWFMN